MTIKFTPNPLDMNAHTFMNQHYADAIPGFERLFVDPDTKTEVLPDHELLTTLRAIIIDDMIKHYATQTPDTTSIAPIINTAALSVVYHESNRRVTKSSITHALLDAIAKKKNTITIFIGLSHVYFPKQEQINYLDWRQFSTTAHPAAPPTHTDPDTATVPSSSANITVHDLTTALNALPASFATALANVLPNQPLPAGTPPHTHHPRGVTLADQVTNIHNFNARILPADVRTRYEAKNNNDLILRSTVTTRFSTGNLYHPEGFDKLILSDGSLFVARDPDSKGLFRSYVVCKNDSKFGIRQWYEAFFRHLLDHGYYCHPFYSYRKDHGGQWGFTCGDDQDDDLPLRMHLPIRKMSQTLFTLLMKNDMFPPGSKAHDILQVCYGDGYHALKTIVQGAHPIFDNNPARLVKNFPLQRDLDLLQYYQIFMDFLQLRAFVMNINTSLEDTNTLDIFIDNTKYSEFFSRVTREERANQTLRHKYTGAQIVDTLQKFLQAPDSPLRHTQLTTTRTRFSNYAPRNYNQQKPIVAPIQQLQQLDYCQEINPDDETPPQNIIDTVYDLFIPTDRDSRKLFTKYEAAIQRIEKQPHLASNQPCLACDGTNHRFAECPVLLNTPFLQGHYIRYKQHKKREEAAIAKHFTSTQHQQNIATERKINAMNAHDTTENIDEPFDIDQDFQLGRL